MTTIGFNKLIGGLGIAAMPFARLCICATEGMVVAVALRASWQGLQFQTSPFNSGVRNT
jgi:hypothetical protein